MYNFQFFPLHCPSRNAISSKVFNEFSKTSFWLKDEDGGYCGWKFQVHRYFGFAIATVQLFQHPENVKISIFPFTLSQQKCYIFKTISRICKNVFFAERYGRWLLYLKISIPQTFSFCNSNATNFPKSRKCQNLNFSLYTVPAEMLYLQKCLTDFQKLSLTERRGRWLLWFKISIAQNFGFAIATLQIFQHLENVKISIFPFTLSQQKCYIFKSI